MNHRGVTRRPPPVVQTRPFGTTDPAHRSSASVASVGAAAAFGGHRPDPPSLHDDPRLAARGSREAGGIRGSKRPAFTEGGLPACRKFTGSGGARAPRPAGRVRRSARPAAEATLPGCQHARRVHASGRAPPSGPRRLQPRPRPSSSEHPPEPTAGRSAASTAGGVGVERHARRLSRGTPRPSSAHRMPSGGLTGYPQSAALQQVDGLELVVEGAPRQLVSSSPARGGRSGRSAGRLGLDGGCPAGS